MAIPFLTPARCVLLIGDDALHVYNVSFNAVTLVDSVLWQADDFEDIVVGLIRKDCGGKPVLVLNDMTDQHFKGGQRLPNVGPMDRANVLQRKLKVAFPNYPIRGALPIKKVKKGSKSGKMVASGLYLYAAVPMSEPVAKTVNVVRKSMTSIAGFCLLPIETADMVSALSTKLAGKSREPSRWVIFMGQHHGGALRQVITRDGQLAMTRMTPISMPAEGDDVDAWAQEVFQEFRATIGYLSRFGFSSDDSMDVIVVANPQAGNVLEGLIDVPCHYSTFTAPEAAREIGISIGRQEAPYYADALHVAWAGRKNKFVLPMQARELTRIHMPRQVAAVAMFLLILGGGYLAWQAASHAQSMVTTGGDLDSQRRVLAQAEVEYEQEVTRMAELGFDVKLIQGAIDTYDTLDKRRMKVMPLILKIDEALGNELRLDALNVEYVLDRSKIGVTDAYGQPVEQTPEMEAALKLSFPPSIEPEYAFAEVNNLQRRLSAILPDFDVVIEKKPAGLEYNDDFTGEAGRTAEDIADEELVAEIKIRGAVQ